VSRILLGQGGDKTPPRVYVDTLLDDPGTRQEGNERYRPLTVTLGVFRYQHSLMTAVGNARKTEQTSTLILRLDGKYQDFRATIGRDDSEAVGGPGHVYFEINADGRPLFKSLAIRSPRNVVEVTPPANLRARSAPQEISVPIAGVTTLTLITRYASDLPQKAVPQIARAKGCVWGDARLIPLPATALKDAALRDTLREAILRLCGPLFNPVSTEAVRPLPLKLAIPPLRVPRSPRFIYDEATMRSLAEDYLAAARRGATPLFTLLSEKDAKKLASSHPASRGAAVEPVIAGARKMGANVVLLGTVLPPGGGKPGWTLDLILADCAQGDTISSITAPLPDA
jgi:hypothetical protein